MKTKRSNRLIALVLAVMMIVPMISVPATAWSVDAEQKYYEEDFNSDIVMAENGETIAVKDDKTNAKSTVITAHKYSKLLERASEDMALLVPFKGISEGLRLQKDPETGEQIYVDKKNENGQVIKYPVMIPFLDAEGNEVKDADGNTVMVQQTEIATEDMKVPQLDENGEPVKDGAGNIVYETVYGDDKKPVQVPIVEVAYKYELDEYGRPVREIPYDGQYNLSGTYGAFVYARDENGQRIYDLVEKKDEAGNVVLDENGAPVMVPETRYAVKFVTANEKTEAYEKYSEGNPAQILKLENQSVASSDKGIFLQMDIKIHYNNDLAIDPTLVGYDFGAEFATEPTVNIMFAKVNHSKVGTSTSTSNIVMATLNLKTGVLTNAGDKVPGATNLRQDVWYTLKFEIDLVNGTYTTYTYNQETGVEEQYALFGNISPDNSSKGLANIAIDNGQLQIKLNDAAGAYDNRAGISYEEMTNIIVDNVAMYKNEDYVEPEVITEPEILNKISGETFNTRAVGMSPKAFGYVNNNVPDTARIVEDPNPESEGDRAVRVDFRGYIGSNPDGYYIWPTSNSHGDSITNVVVRTDENGNKYLTGKSKNYGNVSGYIWGDDQIEREHRINSIKNPLFGSDNPDEPEYLEQYYIDQASVTSKPSGLDANAKLFVVTAEWYDAMLGGSNVARSFSPGNPVLRSSDYKKVALQVKYWISADAVGNIEMQMNTDSANGSNGWIDTIRVDAKRNADGTPGDVIVSYGQNYEVVAGHSKVVERETWFTVNIVFNLENHWEDIFLDGEYLYTTKPRNVVTDLPVKSNTWSIGKPIRNNVPGDLEGYYLVDDVMIFNDQGIVDDIYNRAYAESFDGITADTDLSTTNFATDMPSSVIFYDDTANGHASTLKLDMGLDLEVDDSTKIFWSTTEGSAVYEAGKYNPRHAKDKHILQLNGKNATGSYDTVKFVGEVGVSEIWELTKGGVTYTYKETSYAEYAAFYCFGDNVNKNWVFAQPGFGAATNDLIAADFELYIPEDNYGVVQSRLKEYNNGRKVYKEGIALYSIDTATGTIGVGESTEGAQLNVGEWNNISVVINIKTGEASIFVNSLWVVDGQLYSADKDEEGNALPETNISFMNDNWVPAMVVAKPGDGDKLKGYVLIDDLRMFSVTDELIVIDGSRENFISATYNGVPVEEGDKFFITDDVSGYEEVSFDVSEYEDLLDADNMKDYEIAFRGVLPAGLRFTTEVDEDMLAELIEEWGEENVKMGTIILPANMVSGWDTIKKADLDAANKGYINIEFQDYYEDNIMAASVTNIVKKNYTRDFRAMAYVEITLTEMGNTATICSDLMTANIAKLAHTYLDENDELDGPLAALVEEYASFYRG